MERSHELVPALPEPGGGVTTVTWFRHHHENRNDLLRFGLMRLHRAGRVTYVERPLADAHVHGFVPGLAALDLRHKSFLLVKPPAAPAIRCIVDSEDSFVFASDLMACCDVYFCAGYNEDIFARHQFVRSYAWQTERDLAWYRARIERSIQSMSAHFHKVRRFVPIGPNLARPPQYGPIQRKLGNAEAKLRGFAGMGMNWGDVYRGFEDRYSDLLRLRSERVAYDVTLSDTAWGWPLHRVRLHRQLAQLRAGGRNINAILKWEPPVECNGSVHTELTHEGFPMRTGLLDQPYELMLARSRLAVFACGFHWGWRNIMTLGLLFGLPTVTDRLLVEPYFDMSEFKLWQVEDPDWHVLADLFVSDEEWEQAKTHNQRVYDERLEPSRVAKYFLEAAGT